MGITSEGIEQEVYDVEVWPREEVLLRPPRRTGVGLHGFLM